MKSTATPRRLQRPARSLVAVLRQWLTPEVWKQAHQARGRERSSRWSVQPLVLVLLLASWCCGDSAAERFETAKAFGTVCLAKRRRPGKTVQGFQKALAKLPMPVLRTVAAAVRQRLALALADRWRVDGFVPLGCDGTRLTCPRAAVLEERLGQAGKAGSAPTVWLTALVHLRLGVPWAWQWGKGTASERDHLRRLLPTLPAQALIVTDAGYVGYDLAKTLVEKQVQFLIRVSSQATLFTVGAVRLEQFREGDVYYGPGAKSKNSSQQRLLPLRLIRVREKQRKHDVWLLTNVERRRLSVATASQMYRWRWESEGLFRTYKRTLAKTKLVSRTVRLVHREAEGSLLATQLLLAQGALAMPRPRALQPAAVSSPRQVLRVFRQELQAAAPQRRASFAQRLHRAQRERRPRTSAKVKRDWLQRKEHKPPKPPRILKLSEQQKASIARQKQQAA